MSPQTSGPISDWAGKFFVDLGSNCPLKWMKYGVSGKAGELYGLVREQISRANLSSNMHTLTRMGNLMANSIWHNWMSNLGLAPRTATKRIVRDSRRWELATELLENRAMLSAASASAPVAAEVANGKAVAAPNVAGTWDVSVTGLGDGTAVLTQKGAKVTAVITVVGFPTSFKSVGKFKAATPHSISDTIKVPTPNGKVTVTISIDFGQSTTPTSFTGSVGVFGETFALTGTKQGVGTSALPKSAKAVIPNIAGAWMLDASSSLVTFQDAQLTITQDGKKFTGTASFTGGSINLTGKVRPNGHITGKATVQSGEDTLTNQKYFADLTDDFLTFSGEVNLKSLDEIINIDGVKDA